MKNEQSASAQNLVQRNGPQHDLLRQPGHQAAPTSDQPAPQNNQAGASALIQLARQAPQSLSPGAVKSLHQATGSRAAQSLLAPRAAPHASAKSPMMLQTKLTVGPAGDRYEQEADRVAASVVRQIQRQPAVTRAVDPVSGEAVSLQRWEQQPVEEVRLDAASGAGLAGGPVDGGTEKAIQSARGGGKPLAPKVRSSMEGAFNANFNSVRVHTNNKADSLNRSLNARAFTTGNDVFFKQGTYNPGSSDGQKLIAHELTHVVQQSGSGISRDISPDIKRQTIQHTGDMRIQRQLSFDDSWEESMGSYLTGYSKAGAQKILNDPFQKLEKQVALLKKEDPSFKNEELNKKWSSLQRWVRRTKQREIKYSQRASVLRRITERLQLMATLESAPRKAKVGTLSVEPSSVISSQLVSSIWEDSSFLTDNMLITAFGHSKETQRLLDKMEKSKKSTRIPPSSLILEQPWKFTGVDILGQDEIEIEEDLFDSILPKLPKKTPLDSTVKKSMPDNVKEDNGKWILSFPNIGGYPVLSAEVVDFKLSAHEKSQLSLVNPKLHVPTVDPTLGTKVTDTDLPIAVDATFSSDEGLAADIYLTEPQVIGSMLTIQSVVGHYQKGSFSMDGKVAVTLPGVKPFQAGLEYLGEQHGYAITSSRVAFDLPNIGGAKTIGYLDELEYTSRMGAFKGRGFFEANIPLLGKTTAKVAMSRNKLQRADLVFLESAFPAVNPFITGNGRGFIDFDNYGRFLEAELSGDFDLSLRRDEDKSPPKRLTGGAFIKEGKFGAGLKLHDDLELNQYLKLNAFAIDIGPDGEVTTKGSFGIEKIKDAPDMPWESTDKDLTPTPQTLPTLRAEMLSASLDYGYDLYRGFWLNGQISVPLNREDQSMLSGRLNYSKGKLNADVEVGDANLIREKTFTKELYAYHDTFAMSPWGKVKGLAKLGGLFAEVDARLDFRYTIGPVTVDAHGTLANIDLLDLSADIDPFVIEEVRGGAQAALQGTPYLGLAAWFASEDFASVRGGLAFPVTAVLGTEAILKTKKMSFVDGKFEGSDLMVDLPLAFGINAMALPHAEVYALRGLIDKQIHFAPLAQTELMAPRLLFANKEGTHLNALRKTYTSAVPPYLPTDLETAPRVQQDLVLKGSASDVPKLPPMNPKAKKEPTKNYNVMPHLPFDLKKLTEGMVTDERLKQVTDVINAIQALAAKFDLGEKLNSVISWLDDWGLLAPLMRGGEVLEKFVDLIESGVDFTLKKLWELAGIEPKTLSDPEEESTPVDKNVKDESSTVRPQRVIFALGPSRVWVMSSIAEGEQTAVEIEKNRLKESGLDLGAEMPKLTFDETGKVKSGKFFASIQIGQFGELTSVVLPVKVESSTPVIEPTFENADFAPSKKHLPDVESESMAGTFANTQVRLTKVELNKRAQVTMPNPLPMGGMELQSEQPALLAFEEQNREWMILGRGISFGDRGYITARMLEYTKNAKGVSGKGEITAKVKGLGNARAIFSVADDKFAKLNLTVNSEMVQYPATIPPLLAGQLAGTIDINAKAIEKAAVGGTMRLQHGAVNQGEPVDVQAHLDLTPELEPKELNATLAKPVSLIQGIAQLNELTAKYDFAKKAASYTGGGDLGVMGTKIGVTADYKESNFGLRLDSNSLQTSLFSLKKIAVAHNGTKGWSVGARAEVSGIKGFEHVAADVYYKPNRLGFIVADSSSLPKEVVSSQGKTAAPSELKTAKIPGAKLHAILAFLEYDLRNKQFDGKGELGITIPILEGNTITGAGVFTIEKNALTDLDAMLSTTLSLPPSSPIVSGPVSGFIRGESGRFDGEVKGDLSISSTPMLSGKTKKIGTKSGDSSTTGSKKKVDGSQVKFLLSIGHDSGTNGYLKQTGIANFGGLFKFQGLDIQINSALNVQDTVKGIDSLGGSPSKNLKEVSSKIATSGIARRVKVKGVGEIQASSPGGMMKGGLALKYGESGFEGSTGEISLGTVPDKNGKAGIYGSVTGVYSPTSGFALTTGKLTANLTKGLQATGTLGRQEGADLDTGLDASLLVTAKLMDGTQMYNKSLFEASVRPTIPVIPGLFSIYGDAGVELKLKYGVTPFLLTGQADVSGINLEEGTFDKAFVNIKKEKSSKSKPTGDASVEFLGKPYFGIGAAIATPSLAGISGGLKFPISAKAGVDPVLDANVVYDKEGNLKGNFNVGFPLVLRVKMGVLPYVKGTALGGLINLDWDPGTALEEVDLMAPKQVSMINLNMGKLDKDNEGAQQIAPGSSSELKPASPTQADDQKLEAPVKESGHVKGASDKVGPVEDSESSEEPSSAPIGFAGVKAVFTKGFAKVVETAKSVYDKVAKVAVKLGELAGKGAEVLGTSVKTVAKGILEVGSWILSWYAGDPDEALHEVETSEDLVEVDHVDEFPLFRRDNWDTYQDFRMKQFKSDMYQMEKFQRDMSKMRMMRHRQSQFGMSPGFSFGTRPKYSSHRPFVPRVKPMSFGTKTGSFGSFGF